MKEVFVIIKKELSIELSTRIDHFGPQFTLTTISSILLTNTSHSHIALYNFKFL